MAVGGLLLQIISIHVPLAGDDDLLLHLQARKHFISIHVPLAGDDRRRLSYRRRGSTFLSTSPLRGTTNACSQVMLPLFISIHVPLAGDDFVPKPFPHNGRLISIHVPLAGDDALRTPTIKGIDYFYPRPPCGGRPCVIIRYRRAESISIHVPLAGDDTTERHRA